jgi:hypothetical protein
MTETKQSAHKANEAVRGRALRFRAPGPSIAFAWRAATGWHVRSVDDALRDRVRAALERPVVAPRTHTEPDGERVLDGWEPVDPADARYPTLFMLQLSQLGLDDLTVDLVSRDEVNAMPVVHFLSG